MAGTKKLTGEVLKKSLEMLDEITSLLDKEGISYSLDGGTALGIIREGRLLPWDTDMDLAIDSSSAPTVVNLLQKLPFWRYRVRVRRMCQDKFPLVNQDLRVIKIWRKKWFFLKGCEMLDIFVRYVSGDQCYWVLGSADGLHGYVVNMMPVQFHQALTKIPFNNKEYWVPADTDGFLTCRYGNWRVPVKEWNAFVNDGAVLK